MGDWFWDWMRARSAFLVCFRELLAKHPGEYAIIVRVPGTRRWEFAEAVASARDLPQRIKERGLGTKDFYIERIVEGADDTPAIDMGRPENV